MICAQRGKLYIDVFFLRQHLSFVTKDFSICRIEVVVVFMVML